MFNLTAEFLLKKSSENLINDKGLYNYLEYLCKKFTNETIDDFEFELNNKKRCFNMDCTIYKSKIIWNINCNSYHKTLKITQEIFKLNVIEFKGYELKLSSLDMKKQHIDKNVDRIA